MVSGRKLDIIVLWGLVESKVRNSLYFQNYYLIRKKAEQ